MSTGLLVLAVVRDRHPWPATAQADPPGLPDPATAPPDPGGLKDPATTSPDPPDPVDPAAVPPAPAGPTSPAPGPRLVRRGPLAAVVDTAPARPRPRRRDLLAHQRTLAGLASAGPVVPMRFGTVAPDEDRVRALLAEEREDLLAALDRLTGRVEFNLKALPATDALAALLREDAGVRRLRDAARAKPGYEASVRLGEAVASALDRRAADTGREAVRRLLPFAVESRPGPQVAGCPLNVSFLVAADAAAGFRAEAARLADEWRDRADLRLTGPLPCYSFVDAAPGTVARGG